jgi:hypothetical protein
MDKIELRTLDKKDLLEILDIAEVLIANYLKELQDPKYHHWDNTNWYLLRIRQLRKIIKGADLMDNILTSSYSSIEDSVF